MGPAQESSSRVPSRPKFSWDIKNVPWTDGKGCQEDYSKAVHLWNKFHDRLPDSNSNKIPKELRGIMLQSQLYGRARDLCMTISDSDIQSNNGSKVVVYAIYKREARSVVSDVYQNFMSLLNTPRGSTETFKNFESRFDAQISKLNASSGSVQLPEALTALMLLANSSIENGQRVSVLAATSTNSVLPSIAGTDEFIKEVTYEEIASVLLQCDSCSPKMNSDHATKYLSASSVSPNGFQKRYKSKERRKLTAEQLPDLKRKSKCRQCEKYGHWKSDHLPNGQLKPGVKSTDTAPDTDNVSQGRPKKTVTFNMVQVNGSCSHETSFDFNSIGPLLDDGAPYRGMGLREFTVWQRNLLPHWKGTMDAAPDVLQDYSYWQYGDGDHSSDPGKILCSVPLCIKTDEGNVMSVRTLVIEGSSQWVIGRNVTKRCNIQHIGGNKLVLRDSNDRVQLHDVGFHSYFPYERFVPSSIDFSKHVSSQLYCATAHIHENITHGPWSEIRKVIDKVHRHVCGHSNYHDMKLLLERNMIWNAEVKKYLSQVLDTCPDCLTTSQAQSTRNVSLSSLSRNFNDVVCVDHYHLDGNRIFHIMDSVARYFVGDVVQEMNMSTAIPLFQSLWVSAFWEPKVVFYDSAFDNSEFTMYLESHDIECRPLPPRRHNKNLIASKHRVIRDVFIRLKGSSNDTTINRERLLVQQAMRISNDLYGNDACSAHEL